METIDEHWWEWLRNGETEEECRERLGGVFNAGQSAAAGYWRLLIEQITSENGRPTT